MFERYQNLRQGPRYEKYSLWRIAVGLQGVDRLNVSGFLEKTACSHIEGEISIAEALRLVDDYYRGVLGESDETDRTEEADKVATRIAQVLAEPDAAFSPAGLRGIHKRLFDGLYTHAGMWRECAVSKAEWVLRGASVGYTHPAMVEGTLDYDFSLETQVPYSALPRREKVLRAAKFISGIWQIHPFREGNTRTIAVFGIQYLRRLGFRVNNTPFAEHSWYFRNALVRANYSDTSRGIAATQEYLNRFFDNCLLNANHELRNEDLMVGPTP